MKPAILVCSAIRKMECSDNHVIIDFNRRDKLSNVSQTDVLYNNKEVSHIYLL